MCVWVCTHAYMHALKGLILFFAISHPRVGVSPFLSCPNNVDIGFPSLHYPLYS
jgi:hypothetical protein